MKTHNYEINIKLKFGSDFQRSTWSKMARAVVNTFAEMFKNGHRGNDVEIRFGPPKSKSVITKKGAVQVDLPPVNPQTQKGNRGPILTHHTSNQDGL